MFDVNSADFFASEILAAFLRLHRGNFVIDNIRILKYRIIRQKGGEIFIGRGFSVDMQNCGLSGKKLHNNWLNDKVII